MQQLHSPLVVKAGVNVSAPPSPLRIDEDDDGKGSTHSAFFNFFKQLFGAGILALPHAFRKSGLWGGVAVFFVTCFSSVMSMLVVLQCKRLATTSERSSLNHRQYQELGSPKKTHSSITYPDIAEVVFGRRGYYVVATLVLILELAFCTGWLIVAADNLVLVLKIHWLTRSVMAFLLFPLVAALSCVRWLKDLWVLSLFGLVVYVFGVMGVTYYDIGTRSDLAVETYSNFRLSSLPYFFGAAMYTVEGILMVLPVEGSMKYPKHADFVIGGSTTIFSAIACVFGAVGYIYGLGSCTEDHGAIITDCLPHTASTTVIRVMLAISLILGYPCLMYPVSEIAEELVFGAVPSKLSTVAVVKHSALRTTIVLGTCIVAAACTDFSQFSAVVGAILVPTVGFFVPSTLHMALMRLRQAEQNIPVSWRLAAVDVYLFVLGLLLLIIGFISLS